MDKINILIVDDEISISRALRTIFEKLNYNVIGVASSSRETFEILGRQVPHLITMDIKIDGDLDGIETAAKINSKYDLPILYVSNMDDSETIDRAKLTHPSGFIIKPFEEKDIRASVEMALYKYSMEKRLKESELRYRSLVTSLNEGILLINSEMKIETCNPSAEKILGINSTNLLGKSPFDKNIKVFDEMGEAFIMSNYPAIVTYKTGIAKTDVIMGVELIKDEIKWLSVNTEPIFEHNISTPIAVVVSIRDITLQKNTEEAYKAIVENSIQGLIVIQDEKIVFANDAVTDLLGYSKEEIVNFSELNLKQIINSEDYEQIYSYINCDYDKTQKRLNRYSARIQRKDLSQGCLDVFASTCNFRGRRALQLAFVDITETKNAEEKIKDSESKFRSLFEYSNDGITLTDEAGIMVEWNKAMEDITGYKAEEIIGKNIWDMQAMFFNDDIDDVKYKLYKKSFKNFFANGQAPWLNYPIDFEMLSKDGNRISVQQVGFKIISKRGFMLGAINRNITELTKTQKALKDSEERLRLAMESVNDALWDINPLTYEVNYLSPRWFTMLGYAPDELPHTFDVFLQLLHPDDIELIKEKMTNVLNGIEKLISIEVRMKNKNGTYKWVFSRGKAIETNSEGKTIRFIGTHIDINERKRMEVAIRDSEVTIRTLLNASVDPIGLFETNGTIIALNNAAGLSSGRPVQELIGRNYYDYQPKHIAEQRHQKVDEVIKTGQISTFIEYVGDKINEYSVYPIFNYSGEVIKIAAFSKDLTEIYKAQNELKLSEERYRTLFEDTPVSHWIVDLSDVKSFLDNMKSIGINDFDTFIDALHFEEDNNVIKIIINDINQYTIELFEAESKEHFIDNYKEVFLHDSFTSLKKLFIELFKGKFRYEGESIMRTFKGNLIYGYWKFSISPGYEDNWARVIVSGIDISAKKRIEFALQESEKTLRAILSASPIGIGMAKDRVLLWANDAFFKLFGFKEDQLKNKSLTILYKSEADAKLSGERLYSQINDKGIGSSEVKLLKNNGEEILCLLLAKSIDIQNVNKGQILAVMDITERKKAEEHLRNVSKITNDAEKQKNEAIRIIDRSALLASIGVIAGGITHEINQPLNAIKMGADGILFWNHQNKILPEMMTEMLEGISEAANRIDEIIKHMRSFWVEPNKKEFAPMNINNAVDKAISLISQKLQSSEIKLKLFTSEEELFINANPIQIELIVNNLIINASHALKKINDREKWIKIKTYHDSRSVYLEISDNGHGLPDIETIKLFDPFFSTKDPNEGTGLGLAIVKMFVDRFAAKISARNNSDFGATFTIQFKKVEYN